MSRINLDFDTSSGRYNLPSEARLGQRDALIQNDGALEVVAARFPLFDERYPAQVLTLRRLNQSQIVVRNYLLDRETGREFLEILFQGGIVGKPQYSYQFYDTILRRAGQ